MNIEEIRAAKAQAEAAIAEILRKFQADTSANVTGVNLDFDFEKRDERGQPTIKAATIFAGV